MAAFVLIHGAWHGAWCWRKVTPELEALGHRVITPDLPGLGDDEAPAGEVTLDDYAGRIAGVLDVLGEPAILVGHSMGGIAISAAAELRPEKIRRLVYLAAFLPRNGQSLRAFEEENPDPRVPQNIVSDKDNTTALINPDKVTELFYHDCSDDDIAFARSRLRPQSYLPLAAPVRITERNFGRIPRAYIECTDDQAMVIDFQRAMVRATPCGRVISLKTSHSPFFSVPKELARALSELAVD